MVGLVIEDASQGVQGGGNSRELAAREASEARGKPCGAKRAHPFEDAYAFGRRAEPDAASIRNRMAGDEAGPLEPVDQAGDVRRRDTFELGKTTRVFIEVPTSLSARQKEILDEFGKIEDQKAGSKSFFERIKSSFQQG